MNPGDLETVLGDWLEKPLFEIGDTATTLGTLLLVIAIVAVTIWGSRILGRGVRLAFTRKGGAEEGTVDFYVRFVRAVIIVTGFGMAVHNLGLDLTALFAAGGLIALAIGFAMKGVAENFVSGVILSFERAIERGDVLEVEGTLVKVRRIGVRSTIARGRNDEDLVIPNSVLAQSTVKNFTLRDDYFRMRAPVGVEYSSDMTLVLRTLKEAAEGIEWRVEEREPRILLTGFGDSSVDFEVSVWVREPWDSLSLRSDLNLAIWWALKEKGITIAFPQLDVHFDPAVEGSPEGLRSVG